MQELQGTIKCLISVCKTYQVPQQVCTEDQVLQFVLEKNKDRLPVSWKIATGGRL
jgi:hypothetical protein